MSDGRLSSDVRGIQDRTVEFYSDLYKAEKCDNDCVDALLADSKDTLDLPLTLEELKTAAFQMSLGRAPGIDCQDKAFGRVDHAYLFSTLLGFGSGENLINYVKLLYTDASCLVKVGGDWLDTSHWGACTDDVSVFMSNRVDVQELEDCLQTHCLPRLPRLAVLNAPTGLLAEIQKRLVAFFWSGQRWLKATLLAYP
ncbi:hypothetical protein SRHO_G00266820 [Serrasalmus rhombeus]